MLHFDYANPVVTKDMKRKAGQSKKNCRFLKKVLTNAAYAGIIFKVS
jgi:hypothetical protein